MGDDDMGKLWFRALMYAARRGLTNWMPDELYLKILYRGRVGKKLNLDNPNTFNEKMQWLKIHNRTPELTAMVDKYEAKSYVSDRIGSEYIIPTLGVWDCFDNIDFDSLPNQFVLKCTHDSGGLVICNDKATLNIPEAKAKIERCMKQNYYYLNREWPYKNVKPRIIAEEYMIDSKLQELRDYKFFCFGGEAKFFKIDMDRQTRHRANYYTIDKVLMPVGEVAFPPDFNKEVIFPSKMDLMIELAEKLSKNQPFLRVDFYEVNNRVYFGELTFYPASGVGKWTDERYDKKFGEWIDLSAVH